MAPLLSLRCRRAPARPLTGLMTIFRTILAFALAGFWATTASATTLTFDGAICGGPCAEGSSIDANYGSTPAVAVSYLLDVANPGAGNQLYWWDNNYSDLTNVAYGGVLAEPAVVLTPLSGRTVTLDSFDLGAWPNTDRSSQVTILEGSTIVYSSGPITVLGSVHSHFSGPYSSTSPITIAWGPDGYDTGIDNIAYTFSSPSGVPEPSTWALMLLGLAGLGPASRRFRKSQAATA